MSITHGKHALNESSPAHNGVIITSFYAQDFIKLCSVFLIFQQTQCR